MKSPSFGQLAVADIFQEICSLFYRLANAGYRVRGVGRYRS